MSQVQYQALTAGLFVWSCPALPVCVCVCGRGSGSRGGRVLQLLSPASFHKVQKHADCGLGECSQTKAMNVSVNGYFCM